MVRVPLACRLALSGLLLLQGCASKPTQEAAPELPVPPVPPSQPARRPASQPIRTAWSFREGADDCSATAAAAGASLEVAVRHDAPIRLALTLQSISLRAQAGVPLRFTGPAGSWRVAARATGAHMLAATLGSDETALSHVLVLLGGGTLEVGEAGAVRGALEISPSNKDGQAWFDCARNKVL
ncbi:MAG TPA: hypothetical protein VH855_08045 [Acetobacteraceae bacterium]|jgi:hypothetical protein